MQTSPDTPPLTCTRCGRGSRHPNSPPCSTKEIKPRHPRPCRPEPCAAATVFPRSGSGVKAVSGSQLPWVAAENHLRGNPVAYLKLDAEILLLIPGTSDCPLGPCRSPVGRGLRATPPAASPSWPLVVVRPFVQAGPCFGNTRCAGAGTCLIEGGRSGGTLYRKGSPIPLGARDFFLGPFLGGLLLLDIFATLYLAAAD